MYTNFLLAYTCQAICICNGYHIGASHSGRNRIGFKRTSKAIRTRPTPSRITHSYLLHHQWCFWTNNTITSNFTIYFNYRNYGWIMIVFISICIAYLVISNRTIIRRIIVGRTINIWRCISTHILRCADFCMIGIAATWWDSSNGCYQLNCRTHTSS